jgi:acetoin utilization protein AcuB
MKARDVMTEGPASVRSTAPLREAFDVLQSLNVRHLPVIDKNGELVGMLSDRDLPKISPGYPLSKAEIDALVSRLEMPVSEVMSSRVFAVDPETEVRDVASLMIEHKIGAIPVMSSEGALVGIVSYVDLLRDLVVDERP